MCRCESWTIKKAERQRTDAFQLWFWRRLLSPLDSKEIQPVRPKGNQSWIFTARTVAEAEAPILWPPDIESWLIGKDPDAGKDWRQKKRVPEDEIIRQYHWRNRHDYDEQTPGDSEAQGSLACCSPQGSRELDTVCQLNNYNKKNEQTFALVLFHIYWLFIFNMRTWTDYI